MRVSRKMLNLRFLIYAGLIAFFGYGAVQRYRGAQPDAREAAEGAKDVQDLKPVRMQLLPDGTKVPVYELTPEQAERLLGAPPEGQAKPPMDAPPKKTGAAPAEGDAKPAKPD